MQNAVRTCDFATFSMVIMEICLGKDLLLENKILNVIIFTDWFFDSTLIERKLIEINNSGY